MVSASDDGFRTQTVLASLDPAVDPAFSEIRLDLSAFAGSRNVQIRFSFTSDPSVDFEGWYIDDIRVEQTIFDCATNTGGFTTTTSSTTTTTRPEVCRIDADCNDGNACTTDRCTDGACQHVPADGFVGADCGFVEALGTPACQGERIDPGLDQFIRSRVLRARNLVAQAESRISSGGRGRTRRANAIIRRAAGVLTPISGRTRKARKAGHLSDACATTIDQRIAELRTRILALRK